MDRAKISFFIALACFIVLKSGAKVNLYKQKASVGLVFLVIYRKNTGFGRETQPLAG
jgi:hypothetical protein